MAKQARAFLGIYENMNFPEYVYREFPKEITLQGGKKVIVQNAAEELKYADQATKPVENAMLAQQRDAVANALVAKETELAEKEAKIKELEAQIKAARQFNAEGSAKTEVKAEVKPGK